MSITVYHVTTLKKVRKYLRQGYMVSPLRAWVNISSAERFSKQTGRRVILRLKFNHYRPLEGHKGEAVITNDILDFPREAS